MAMPSLIFYTIFARFDICLFVLTFFFLLYLSKEDGSKVHRKIHKAEREKLKRDRMNDLFIDLTNVLGVVSILVS